MSLSQAATEFLTGRPAGVSAVSRSVAGLLTSWVENGFNCTVRRDSAGLPYEIVAERAGRGLRLTQSFAYSGGVLIGMTGDTIPTVFREEVMSGQAPVSGGGVTDGDKGDIIVSGSGAVWQVDPTPVKARLAISQADVTANAPVSISNATTLTAASHANRQLVYSGTTATLTISADATGGWANDDSIEIHTLAGSSGVPTLATPDGKSVTGSETKIIGAVRKGASVWTTGTTDPAAASASSLPSLFDGQSTAVYPVRGAVTQVALGVQAPSASGTIAVPASTSVNGYPFPARLKNTSTATTANAAANNGHTTTAEPMISPNTTATNPACRARGAYVVADALTACRVAFGITASPPTSGEPSAAVNCAFFGADSTDTQLFFYHNDGSGTCTKETLNGGTGFPANTNLLDLYEWYVEILPGATRTINYYIKNLNTQVSATGTTTSDIPAAGTALRVQHLRNTGANTGTAVSYEFGAYATGGFALMGATS